MAVKDFKEYLITVQQQWLELKADLADFEQAFKDGFITEDKLEEVKNEVAQAEINYQRLIYVDYLLDLPSRRKKKYLQRQKNKARLAALKEQKADKDSVIAENKEHAEKVHDLLTELTKNEQE